MIAGLFPHPDNINTSTLQHLNTLIPPELRRAGTLTPDRITPSLLDALPISPHRDHFSHLNITCRAPRAPTLTRLHPGLLSCGPSGLTLHVGSIDFFQ